MTCEVPALAKGIQLLRLLGDSGPMTLERCAAALGHPKSSVLRMLRTLGEMGLAESSADGMAKVWSARARILPLASAPADRDALRRRVLEGLSASTGKTAEWYVPTEDGFVLIERHAPAGAEVAVRARVGFLRRLDGELDAVAAFAPPEAARLGGRWVYDERGVMRKLKAAEARAFIERASQSGFARDAHYNTNGVRRFAVAVRRGGALEGIIALASHFAPDDEGWAMDFEKGLRQAARAISAGT